MRQISHAYTTWCYCQYTKMVSNNDDILDGLSIIDKYVQIALNNLHLLKQVKTWLK